jgi:hypothetical protein
MSTAEYLIDSDDPTIIPIFRAIDQERHRYFGREVNFE